LPFVGIQKGFASLQIVENRSGGEKLRDVTAAQRI
jgi:hypothetical protein